MLNIPHESTISQAIAIAGLVLAPLCSYFFRIYSQTLDLAQMLVAFYLAFSTTELASRFMSYSHISFMPNFLDKAVDCTDPKFTYICSHGTLVSPLIAWFAVAILMLIVIKIISCCKPRAKYQTFYNFWKGFFRWFSVPLIYNSSDTIIKELQKDAAMRNN